MLQHVSEVLVHDNLRFTVRILVFPLFSITPSLASFEDLANAARAAVALSTFACLPNRAISDHSIHS